MFLVIYAIYIAFMFVNNRVERYVTSLSCLKWLGPNIDQEQSQLIMYKGALGGKTHLPESQADTCSYDQDESEGIMFRYYFKYFWSYYYLMDNFPVSTTALI